MCAGFCPGSGLRSTSSTFTISQLDLSGTDPYTASSFNLFSSRCAIPRFPSVGYPFHQSRCSGDGLQLHSSARSECEVRDRLALFGPRTGKSEIAHPKTTRFPWWRPHRRIYAPQSNSRGQWRHCVLAGLQEEAIYGVAKSIICKNPVSLSWRFCAAIMSCGSRRTTSAPI